MYIHILFPILIPQILFPILIPFARGIAKPTYETFNLFTRLSTNYYANIPPQTKLSTYLQDFQLTYKT